jgi:RNA-directed DNA polymerase
MDAAMPKDAPVNAGAGPERPGGPDRRVSEMQAKLHRWAAADPGRRFDDLFNFVHDPATLLVAFSRVAGNHGANTPGVDGLTAALVKELVGVPGFLEDLRAALKAGTFRPLPVRERKIPKPGGSGKLRTLGIPVIADRVVQAPLKLVLEPIFEADCAPRGAVSPGEVKDLPRVLSQQEPEAGGSPNLEVRVRVGAASTTMRPSFTRRPPCATRKVGHN